MADSNRTLSDIRSTFLSFFERRDHALPGSGPLVPQDDASVLFTVAGMVPFKNYFTGAAKPPFPRAATSQKCVRAGGKHNDLDNVGYTARHHTFFEMLGNFSFGDYFKAEAIDAAWSLLTREFGLPPDRLLVTVYHDDDEAASLWKKVAGLPEHKIIRIATSDNFWSMGDTGPCGPCSEIFYDHGPEVAGGPPGSTDEDGDRFVEVWNLVFMQFEQQADGTRVKLPKPSIDTGMGLERIAAVLQGVHSNYETDLFRSLIEASEALTDTHARGEQAASHRVIADHLRSSCFLIADGVMPSNEGRGYVLRRIMRRAMRHVHLLGSEQPLMHQLVPTLIEQMGATYPELERARAVLIDQLEQEEERFRRTLGRGLSLLEDELAQLAPGVGLPGATAFRLYDTYGFPLDLTEDILRGRGVSVDVAGFESAMNQQRAMGRKSWGAAGASGNTPLLAVLDTHGSTEFMGYDTVQGEGRLLAIEVGGATVNELADGMEAALVFDRTPFYGESGGQAGDHGVIAFDADTTFAVQETKKISGMHVHVGTLKGPTVIRAGARARLQIDVERRTAIRSNHSATHLLHAALRNTLGAHVTQKGSLVEADRFRFDFSHGAPLTEHELDQIEAEVNAIIRQNAPALTQEMAPEQAIAQGAMALFGEKYGDQVRVLSLGTRPGSEQAYSVELCGGTHVQRTGDIALFAWTSESGVAAGIRRIEGVTGAIALEHLKTQGNLAKTAALRLKAPAPELPARVGHLVDENRRLTRELADARKQLALGGGRPEDLDDETLSGVSLRARVLPGVDAKSLRGLADEWLGGRSSAVVAYIAVDGNKVALTVGVSADLKDKLSAVDLVRIGVPLIGGRGGGGRPDLAQGGGNDPTKATAALAAVREAVQQAVSTR